MRIGDVVEYLAAVITYNLGVARDGGRNGEYITPYLEGDPGIGKTQAAKQAAERAGVKFLDPLIIAQYDPAELGGFPYPDPANSRMVKLRPEYLPESGECVLLLDELPQGAVAQQNVVAQLVQERALGKHRLSPGCTIIAAGNPMSNRAGTNPMPTHLRDRLTHIKVETNVDDWLDWAVRNNLAHSVIAFNKHENGLHLSKFDAAAQACPSPRSWAKVSEIERMGLPDHIEGEAVAGTIGDGVGAKYRAFKKVYQHLPTYEEIITNPSAARLPDRDNAGARCAVAIMMAMHCECKHAEQLITYIDRLKQPEFALMFFIDARKRRPELEKERVISKWKLQHAKHFAG